MYEASMKREICHFDLMLQFALREKFFALSMLLFSRRTNPLRKEIIYNLIIIINLYCAVINKKFQLHIMTRTINI